MDPVVERSRGWLGVSTTPTRIEKKTTKNVVGRMALWVISVSIRGKEQSAQSG